MELNAEYNLSVNFILECSHLADYNRGWYLSVIDAIKNEYIVFTEVFETICFSANTISLYKSFFAVFNEYLSTKNYAFDEVFVFIDPIWLNIRISHLIPFLECAEIDLMKYNSDYVSILKGINPYSNPSNEEILKRVSFLYSRIQIK